MKIKCFDVEGNPIELSVKEKQAYVEHIQKKNPNTEKGDKLWSIKILNRQ